MAQQASDFRVFCLVSVLLSVSAFAQSDPYARGLELFRQQQWNGAIVAFEEYEKAHPGISDAPLYAAKSLINLEKIQDAANMLDGYVAVHPASDDAVSLLAYIRFRQDKPKQSLQLFTAAARLKTPSADDLKIVALDYVLLNDYTDAAHYLEESLKMDPFNLEARYHLGRVLYQQNKFDGAIAAFEEVLRHDPNNVKAEENLGLSLEGRNDTNRAIAAYRKAIEMDQSSKAPSEQPYLDLGILLEKLNRAAEAEPLLKKATQLAPNSSKARYEFGKACFSLNRYEEAQKETEEAVRLNNADSASHYLLGRIYQRLGKKKLATQQFALTNDLIGKRNATAVEGMSSGAR
jgi:tetratricopeptide (TPR) repeat protein